MQSTCFPSQGGPCNVAAVNLQTLPAVGTSGSQVDAGYPSYIMVPETYDDTNVGTPADEETSGGDGDGDGDGDDSDGDGDGDGNGYSSNGEAEPGEELA